MPLTSDATQAWTEWLRAMRWDFFTTCAFGHPTSPTAMLHAVTAWLSPLPQSFAAIGVQRGPLGDRLHVHALIGGTGRRPLVGTLLRESWRRGSLDLRSYTPLRGAIEYMVRQADDVELIGAPQLFRYPGDASFVTRKRRAHSHL